MVASFAAVASAVSLVLAGCHDVERSKPRRAGFPPSSSIVSSAPAPSGHAATVPPHPVTSSSPQSSLPLCGQNGSLPTKDVPDSGNPSVLSYILSADEVGEIVGCRLGVYAVSDSPSQAKFISVNPAECLVADTPESKYIFTKGDSVYASITYKSSSLETSDSVWSIGESIGGFTGSELAQQKFRRLTNILHDCSVGSYSYKNFKSSAAQKRVVDIVQQNNRIIWRVVNVAQDSGFHCWFAAGLKDKNLVEFWVCPPSNVPVPWDKLFEAAMRKIPG
ncbi:sensor domain-containing protein [Segniliparus rugosus]|uniref:sensor domain-containing protein n=1 Tax=Segniliparus rugosus TaxID=286804 RepID=UPI00146FC787|nr:sensor domain-containing protein [Segniliparus rugosus]